MKTITFQGDEKHITAISNFHKNTWKDTDNLRKVETRVYVVENVDSIGLMSDILGEKLYSELTDEEFMDLAEEEGRVYSLQGFQEAFNSEDVNTAIDVIRFINVTI